jgi:hypothetical protein
MEQLGSEWTEFCETGHLRFFKKSRKFEVPLTYEKIAGV